MKLRDMPRALVLVTVGMIIANLTGNMVRPFLSLYLDTLGATVQQIGLFFTAQVIMSIIFRMLGGWISDRIGRLPAIAIGSLLGLAAYTGYAAAPTWGWTMVGALLSMIGSSLVGPSFSAYIAESAPEGSIGGTFGLVEGLFLTCQIAGPPMGGFLIERYGYKTMLWTAVGIFVLATLFRLWTARKSSFKISELGAAQFGRDLRGLVLLLVGGGLITWIFIVDGVSDMGDQLVMPFLPIYVTEVGRQSETMVGGLFGVASAVAALAMWPAGLLADRFGERWGIAGNGILGIITWGIMLLFPTREGFFVAIVFAGVGMALFMPALQSLLSKSVPREKLGLTQGVFMSALGVFAIPAPYIGGWLYDNLAPSVPFMVVMGLNFLMALLALLFLRRPAQEVPAEVLSSPVSEPIGD